MILSIYVISLYCNIKHLLKLENICINLDLRMTNASILRILAHATPTPTSRSKGQKSKSQGGGILWRPPSRTACFNGQINVQIAHCACAVPFRSAVGALQQPVTHSRPTYVHCTNDLAVMTINGSLQTTILIVGRT